MTRTRTAVLAAFTLAHLATASLALAQETERAAASAQPHKYSLYTLVAGVSAGQLSADGLRHPDLDFWLGARLHFFDIGIYIGTAVLSLESVELVKQWLDKEPGTDALVDPKASGLHIGGQIGLHHWLAGGVAPRIGIMGRAGRAGFERSLAGDQQSITLNGYAAEIFGTLGIGNHDGEPDTLRWLLFLSIDYAVSAANSVTTPSGSHSISSDTAGYFVGLGFEGGYNVPITK